MSITQRIDATTRIPHEYQTPTPPAPRSVKIELSARCNYRCGFCALRTREIQPKEDMDFDFFKRICREMREAGVKELGVFYLGESFMNPDLLAAAIRHAKQEAGFPYVFLTSNASLAFPTEVKRCFEAGLDSLKWSVNYADETQFAEIAGVSPKYFWRSVLKGCAAIARRRRLPLRPLRLLHPLRRRAARAYAGVPERAHPALCGRALLAAPLLHGQPGHPARGAAGLPPH